MRWLLIDAVAPVLGVMVTLFISVSEAHLGLLLALFAGFFLYIGASDLVPESHHAHPTFWTTAMTLVGAAVLFTAIRLASI
jgi:ZIP family zinc transporter